MAQPPAPTTFRLYDVVGCQLGVVVKNKYSYGFVRPDGGGDVFLLPSACIHWRRMIPPVGTRVIFTACTCPAKGGLRALQIWEADQAASSLDGSRGTAGPPGQWRPFRQEGERASASLPPSPRCARHRQSPLQKDVHTIQLMVEDGDSMLVDYYWRPGIDGHTKLLQALRAAAAAADTASTS